MPGKGLPVSTEAIYVVKLLIKIGIRGRTVEKQ